MPRAPQRQKRLADMIGAAIWLPDWRPQQNQGSGEPEAGQSGARAQKLSPQERSRIASKRQPRIGIDETEIKK